MINSFKIFVGEFNKIIVIKGFVNALFFSSFIYLEYFGVTNQLIYSINAVVAILLIFKADRPTLFVSGFFVGVLWFYWISFSMRFYDLEYLMPFAIVGIGLVYAFVFLLFGIVQRPFFKIIALYFVQYLSIFDFDWFQPQLLLVNSYFGVENFHFDFLMVSIAIAYMMRGYIKLLAIFPFIFAIDYTHYNFTNDTKIYLADPKLDQAKKWDPKYRQKIFANNYKIIQKAIDEKYDVVVLPEASFPTLLNIDPINLMALKKLSFKIGIITGALSTKNGDNYNSTFVFEDGSMRVIDKYVLVPFGEYIPLPKVLKDFINNVFYDGASDYKAAKKPSNFMIKDKMYTNAICYEATSPIMYKNSTGYMIATSNNSWFAPSTQPALQRLLIKLYAKRAKTIVYHSANMGGTGVIYP